MAVYHANNGNARGARRLFHSGRRYMSGYPARHFGLAFHHRDTEITEFVRSLLCALCDSLVNYQWIRDQILRFAA